MNVIYRFNGSVCSNLDCVKKFLDNTLISLDKFLIDDELLFDVKLILNELVVNGAMHGNKKDFFKKVYLDVIVESDSIRICVRDEGDGINFDTSYYDCKSYKCSGRGLVIVEALSDKLILNKNEVIAIINF